MYIMKMFGTSLFLSIPAGKQKQGTKLIKQRRSVLERFLSVQLFPNKTTVKKIALQTGLIESQVYDWFVRARHKIRQEKCQLMTSRCKHKYIDNTRNMSVFETDYSLISNMSIEYTCVYM